MLNFSKLYVIFITSLFFSVCESYSQKKDKDSPWHYVKLIVEKASQTSFPSNTVNILDFGAIADGLMDNTKAFKNAIEACAEKGGGKVVVPKGKFVCGPIHLKSTINLYLEEGAEILFSTNPKDYYPLVHTSWEGTELMNYSPLIYAYKQKNVAVTGKGTLNGRANNSNWWPWCGKDTYGWEKGMPRQHDDENRPRLVQMAEDNVPVSERKFGEGHYLRPTFLETFQCENVIIRGIKIINAPFWVIHPIKCSNVLVDSVTIESHGPNNDGCDPEYSKNVVIRNSYFNTGDDCIAIKSGRNNDGRRVNIVSENIVVQNCKMIDGHGGVVMGSEISAGVRNVFVEDCTMDSPNLDRAIRIKTNSKRGGFVENVYVRNIEVGQVKEAVLKVNMFYGTYANQTGNFIPEVNNITLENIKVKNGGKYGILAEGYKEKPIKNIVLKDVTIENVKEPYRLKNVKDIKYTNTFINGKLMKNNK